MDGLCQCHQQLQHVYSAVNRSQVLDRVGPGGREIKEVSIQEQRKHHQHEPYIVNVARSFCSRLHGLHGRFGGDNFVPPWLKTFCVVLRLETS